MGKGGGNVVSCFTSDQPSSASKAQQASPVQGTVVQKDQPQEPMATKKIFVIFYSTYGHVYKMAQSELKGINSVEGVEGILYQVNETLPEDILAKMHAAPKPEVPIINAHDLPNADGLMFGFPTRFGGMPSQMKALFDATGGLWSSNKLAGKPAAMFTSTASQGGGQETTILNSLSNVVHHGMIFVPAGYGFGAPLYSNEEARGGSAWGAGTLANGDGSRQPSKVELDFAEYQGKRFAEVVRKLAA
ncbi:hypothetical protein CVIRNUC_008935 [Coccomyxa viridis]|uniref:NAD(P)H dehydrogenase (quinone) n=1 Tax=Coccomyxa viridis TaxID=1274662 RepID=A0AAV1IF64_9CHLO|nr:hypothetical protein CVIRNUC_008935 [Coccomyxa viridis]